VNNDFLVWKGSRRTDPGRPRPLADAVLRLIWEERRISRADIAQKASLSRSTVSEIVNEILPMGLIAEIGEGPSRGGRRPIVLEFQDDACVILGVEMGASHVAVVLTNLRGEVLAWKAREHAVRSDPPGTRKTIAELCKSCLETSSTSGRPLVGVGIAVPSPVDPSQPDRLSTVVLPAWQERLGLDDLSAHYGVPLLVDNDANLGALAEQWWGLGKDVDNLAFIKVATGIGSGHIIDGEIYRGATGFAGEIGHMPIDPDGEPCICGLRGCLATFIGRVALQARAAELAADFPRSSLTERAFTVNDLEDAALAGDPLALEVVCEAAEHLGTAIAILVNLMNPAMVVLGGEFARLGNLVLDPLRRRVRSHTLISPAADMKIMVSRLGPQSVAIGAATLVLKAALGDSGLFPVIKAPAKTTTGSSAK
jgi:predicted NBD/HSP70 family sugar kinase